MLTILTAEMEYCLNSVSFYVRTVRNIDDKEMREMPRHFKSNLV